MANTRDEILRLVVQTEGDADIKATSDAIAGVGTSAGIADPHIKELVDQLVSLNDKSKSVNALIALNAQLDSNAQKLEAARAKVADFQAQIAATDTPARALSTGLAAAERSVLSLTTAQQSLSSRAADVASRLQGQGIDTKNLAAAHTNLSQQVSNTTGEITSLAREQAEAAETSKRHAEAVQEFRGRLLELVSVAAAAELALKAIEFGKEQLSGAADIEQIFSRIKALSGEAAEGLGELDEKVAEAGKAVNDTTQEAATALLALKQNGLSVTDAYSALIPTLQLAKIANIDFGTAAASVVQSLKLFGLQASDTQHVVDVLTAASQGSTDGLAGFSEGLQKIAPAARQAGLDFEQTATILATLTKGGQSAGNASKGLKAIFDDLRDSGSDLSKALFAAGDSSADFRTAIATASTAGAKTNDILAALKGSARTVFELFIQQGPQAFDQVKTSIDAAGGSAKTFSDLLDKNLNAQFKKLQISVKSAGEELVKPILQPLQDEFTKLADRIDAFAKTEDFHKLEEAIGTFARDSAEAFEGFVTKAGGSMTQFTHNVTGAISETAESLGKIKDNVIATASAIQFAANTISAAYHGVGVAIDASVNATVSVEKTLVDSVNTVVQAGQRLVHNGETVHTVLDDVSSALESVRDASGTELTSHIDALQEKLRLTEKAAAGAAKEVTGTSESLGVLKDKTQLASDSLGLVPNFLDAGTDSFKRFSDGTAQSSEALVKSADALTAHATAIEAANQKVRDAKSALDLLAQSGEANTDAFNKASHEYKEAEAALAKLSGTAANAKESAHALEEAFGTLGVTSSKKLQDTADAFKKAFDIINAAQDGSAAKFADTQNAFIAYAKKQLEAAYNLNDASTAVTVQQLNEQASVLGLSEVYDKLQKSVGKTAEAQEKAAEKAKEAADKQAEAAEKVKEAAQKSADAMEAADRAARNLDEGVSLGVTGLSALGAALFKSLDQSALTQAGNQILDAKNKVAQLTAEFTAMGEGSAAAFQLQYGSVQVAQVQLAKLSAQLKAGTSDLSVLDSQTLSGLQTALDAAISKANALTNAEKSALAQLESLNEQLQDQVDQDNNDQIAIEDRRYQKQLQDIKDAAAAAGAAGQAQAAQTLALAQKVHDDALLKIKQQADAQKAADAQQAAQQQAEQQQQQKQGPTPAPSPSPSPSTPASQQVSATFNLVVSGAPGSLDNISQDELQRFAYRATPMMMPIFFDELRRSKSVSGL